MNSPPQKKARGELASNTARKLIALREYTALKRFANVFGLAFPFFEQRRCRLPNRIHIERNVQ
jgi:hypothetical protein